MLGGLFHGQAGGERGAHLTQCAGGVHHRAGGMVPDHSGLGLGLETPLPDGVHVLRVPDDPVGIVSEEIRLHQMMGNDPGVRRVASGGLEQLVADPAQGFGLDDGHDGSFSSGGL